MRERLTAGDTDQQIEDFVVARYGEFVLLKPRFGPTRCSCGSPPAMFLVALLIVVLAYRRRSTTASPPAALSAAEERKLKRLLDDR